MNFITDSLHLASNNFDKVPSDQLNKLLRRPTTNIEAEEFDGEGLAELETFCQKHGILAANFGNMSPRAALKMLQGRVGKPITEQTKRGLLHG